MRCAWCGTPTLTAKSHRLHTKNCEERRWCQTCGWCDTRHTDGSPVGVIFSDGPFQIGPVCDSFKPKPRRYRVHGRRVRL